MTTTEVGEKLGISGRRVRALMDKGRLAYEQAGQMRLVRADEVERFAREQAEEAGSGKKRGPKPNVIKQARGTE